MPGLISRKFEEVKGLHYDPSTDVVSLLRGYRGVRPIVGVRSIIIEGDAVHLNDLMSRDKVSVGGGVMIRGNILAGSRFTASPRGETSVIIGDIGVPVREGEALFSVKEGGGATLMLLGNAMAGTVRIESPTIVVGNIVAQRELEIRSPTIVLGRVLVGTKDVRGKAYLEKTTFYQLYVHGDVEVGEGCTTFMPVIASKGGDLKVRAKRVRVFNLPCMFCGETEDPIGCPYYLRGECPLARKGGGYDYLADYDLSHVGDYSFASWFWRASPLMIVQNVLIKKLLYLAYQASRRLEIEPDAKRINGARLEDFPKTFLTTLVEKVRGEAGATIEEVRKMLFKTIEEYFKERGIKYIKCQKCGMPNPAGEKICIYCGSYISSRP